MKPRFDSVLDQFSDDQQAQVYDWLNSIGYTETINRIAAPEPDGFALKTHRASLHRFYLRYSAQLKSEHLQEAGTLLSSDPAGGQTFASAAEQTAAHIAFQISTSPPEKDSFKNLSRWVSTQKEHQHKAQYLRIAEDHVALARERLALEREKFQFNAARQALIHHDKLGEIMRDDASDDEAKIQAAREQLFGKDVVARTAGPLQGERFNH
ncbi:MAG TPA: hypothetical protein VF773_00805 [Verrucomicrobiae bacterium]